MVADTEVVVDCLLFGFGSSGTTDAVQRAPDARQPVGRRLLPEQNARRVAGADEFAAERTMAADKIAAQLLQ